jgi:hypothetical protein
MKIKADEWISPFHDNWYSTSQQASRMLSAVCIQCELKAKQDDFSDHFMDRKSLSEVGTLAHIGDTP